MVRLDLRHRRWLGCRAVHLLHAPAWWFVMSKRYRRDRLFMQWATKYPMRAFMVYVALAVVAVLLSLAANYIHDARSVAPQSVHGLV
jgi:hypothetical protein